MLHISLATQVDYPKKRMGVELVTTGESGPEPTSKTTFYARLGHISVPFLVKLSTSSNSISPYILMGPRYNYLLNYQSELLDDVLANFEKGVFGATIGIGIVSNHLQFLKPALELRYNFDVNDSYKPVGQEGRNNAFDVRIGFSL